MKYGITIPRATLTLVTLLSATLLLTPMENHAADKKTRLETVDGHGYFAGGNPKPEPDPEPKPGPDPEPEPEPVPCQETGWTPAAELYCPNKQVEQTRTLADCSTASRTVSGTSTAPACSACTDPDYDWTPEASGYCETETITQTRRTNCIEQTRSVTGSQQANTPWAPAAYTVCSGKSFTQTRNGPTCQTETRSATGTKTCAEPPKNCNATKINNCNLPNASVNTFAGACAINYNGACNYKCTAMQGQFQGTTWIMQSNSCAQDQQCTIACRPTHPRGGQFLCARKYPGEGWDWIGPACAPGEHDYCRTQLDC